ncbi:hypothetical protein AAGM73_24145, partial [Klebsiella pneumoniae]
WLMMSLWDALRMNMMISYQELVRTFPNTLSFTNNSPLHITVINAEAIDNKGKIYPLKNFMLLPYSHHAVNIASMQRLHKMKYINDYGAVVDIPIKK